MSKQVKQFLKMLLVVIVMVHLIIGAVLLVSWISGRHHASGSEEPPATAQRSPASLSSRR